MTTRTHVSIEGVVPWPDEVAQAYRRAGYWQGTSLASHIAEHVQRQPDAEALVDGATRLTYQQLWDRSAACAQALLDLGMTAGDRIVVQLPNSWEFVALALACFRTGIIPVMALPAHRRHEITHMATLSEATAIAVADFDSDADLRQMAQQVAAQVPSIRAVLVHGELSAAGVEHAPEYSLATAMKTMPRFLEADHEPAGSDVACFLLSGGTTGLPKLIVRTTRRLQLQRPAGQRCCRIQLRHRLFGHATRQPQLPVGMPGHPRRTLRRRSRSDVAFAFSRAGIAHHRRRTGHRRGRCSGGRAAVDRLPA